MKKRTISILLALSLLLALLPVEALAAELADASSSGTCGQGVRWVLDEAGTLTISGTGAMTDFQKTSAVPWYSRRGSIKTIVIAEGVTHIGDFAFYESSNLTNVVISSSVTSIGKSVFAWCTGLTSITIPDGVTSIGEHIFSSCGNLTSVTIPNSVTSMRSCAFYDCSKLTSAGPIGSGANIELGWKTEIPNDAFNYCWNLTSVAIPKGVTSIGDRAFSQCRSLTGITIPDSVTSIGDSAFYDCSGLTDIYYSGSESEWSNISIGNNNTPLLNAAIHYNSTGPAYRVGKIAKEEYIVHVVDQNGKSLPGATVTRGEETAVTAADGLARLKFSADAPQRIKVELNGYIVNASRNLGKSANRYETVILYPSIQRYKLTSCRYSNSPSMTPDTDLLATTKTISLGNMLPQAGSPAGRTFYVSCDVGDLSDTVDRYELWQGTNKIEESKTGSFTLSTESFTEGGRCSIRVVSTSGDEVTTHINLRFATPKVDGVAKQISLDGGSYSADVRNDIPFIGGSTFSYTMPLKIPVTYLLAEDKIQIGLNVNITGGESAEEQLKNAKDLTRYAKRAGSMKLGKLSERDEKIFKSLIKGKNGFTFLENGEVNVLGYLEADFGSSTAKGNIMLQGKIDPAVKFDYTTWVVFVPVRANIELGLEAGLIGEVSYDWKKAVLLGNLDIEASAKLTAFGGVGAADLVGVGAYGSAELAGLARILGTPGGLQNLALTGELGLKAYLGEKTGEKSFAYNTWPLYPTDSARMFSEEENWRIGIYDAGSYQTHDLSYLMGESEWMGAPVILYDAAASTTLTPLLKETYRNSQPVMAAGNDGIYAAFLRADAGSGQVYAAVTKYNGSAWLEPVRVDTDAVLDDAPVLCTGADGAVWLAYAKTEPDFDADSLADYARKQTIVVGIINPNSLSFTKMKEYKGTGYAHLQQLQLINNIPTLAWADSAVTDDNSVLWPTSSTLYTASFTNGTWGEAVQIAAVNSPVGQLILGERNGAPALAYTVDADGNYYTAEDGTLYCNGELLASGVQGRVKFGQVSGMAGPDFVWNGDGCLESVSSEQISAPGISSEYALAGDRIYYSAADGNSAHLTTLLYDNGSWSSPITLTGGERYLENLSVVSWNNADYLLGMDTLATINTSVTDSKDLVWAAILPSSDLRLDDVSYDLEGLVPGEPVSVTLTVTNAGDHVVTGIDVLQDGGGSGLENCSLRPGESMDIVRTITCPTELTKYTFSVYESGEDDFTRDNNTFEFSIGYADLSVQLSEQRIGTFQALQAVVTNEGIAPASGSVCFSDENGTVLNEISFEPLAAGDNAVIVFPGDFCNGDYTASLIFDDAEGVLSNGADTIHVERSSEIQTVTLENTTVNTTVFAGEAGTAYCAVYDMNKKQLAICEAAVMGGTQEIRFAVSNLDGADSIKVFLLGEDAKPQCSAKCIDVR